MTLRRRCLGCGHTYPVEDSACPKCESHAGDVVEVERAISTKSKPAARRRASKKA